MGAANIDLTIEQGKTFTKVLRWESAPLVYKPITAIAQGAPVSVTCPNHGLPSRWRAAVASVLGMVQINALSAPPRGRDFHWASVVDANTIQFNDINAAAFSAYVSGGYLVFSTPTPLVGFTARMSIKDRYGGTELLRLDTTNARITVDPINFTTTLTVDAVTTAGLAWTNGVYDLELVSASGVVTALIQGAVLVTPEVTTT